MKNRKSVMDSGAEGVYVHDEQRRWVDSRVEIYIQ